MFVLSYVIILAFHPKLKIERVIIQQSFGRSLVRLTTNDPLINDEMLFVDVKFIKQFKDSAVEVSRKKCKNAIAQIFSIELYLAKKPFWLGLTEKLNLNI